jgi:F-type H+/Na+-transporting ATPase subunit alpha
MSVSLYAANAGFLDNIEVKKVREFESALLVYMRTEQSALMAKINEKGDFSDEIKDGLHKAIEHFARVNSW